MEHETWVNLIFIYIDFDSMLGMDWLDFYHAILYCYAKIVTLATQGIPRLLQKGTLNFGFE